jgi:chromatin remodeling complex protein RSC6
VGIKKGTRIAILDAFWQYVKENKLQDIENKEIINCD